MSSYSMDLRVRVLKDCDAGMLTRQGAEKYQVSPAWVRRLKQRRRENGEIEPRPPGHRPSTSTVHAQPIRELIQAQPDLTLVEIKAKLGLTLSLTTIWRVVRSLGLTFKKKSSTRPSKSDPTSPRNAGSGEPTNPSSTANA
jgi:transposase